MKDFFMKVMLSIKPQYVDKIFSQIKRYEFRKSIFKNENIDTVIVYATKPVSMLVGEFKIKRIYKNTPLQIWESTKNYAGISEKAYFRYFKDKKYAYAIEIGDIIKYPRSINPYTTFVKFSPPQSYVYVDDNLIKVL